MSSSSYVIEPPKASHGRNPETMEAWANMPGDRDFYVVRPGNSVGRIKEIREATVMGYPHKYVTQDEPLYAGSIVPAKAFGPGADLQRHVDNGAIREATPWEIAEHRRDFAEDAGLATALEGAATVAPAPDPDKAKEDRPRVQVAPNAPTRKG